VPSRGPPVSEGPPDECVMRGVERLWRFPGPKGAPTEIFTTPLTTASRLAMSNKAFVTGDGGMGHVAILSKDVLGMHGYYSTLFDARLSDFILERIGPMNVRIRFLRVNERHHSIAVAGVRSLSVNPIRTRVQHVNVQVAELDDMVAAYERVTAEGFTMMWSVGQHPNDRELSFYCKTPPVSSWKWVGTRSWSPPISRRPGNPRPIRASRCGGTRLSARTSSTR